jgi:hypothetical protein
MEIKMAIVIKNTAFRRNKLGGIKIEGGGNANVHIDGAIVEDIDGYGLHIVDTDSRVAARNLGFPDDVDPREIAALLEQLRDTQADQRNPVAENSPLLGRVAKQATNVVALVANLVEIAGSPLVMGWITRLLS